MKRVTKLIGRLKRRDPSKDKARKATRDKMRRPAKTKDENRA